MGLSSPAFRMWAKRQKDEAVIVIVVQQTETETGDCVDDSDGQDLEAGGQAMARSFTSLAKRTNALTKAERDEEVWSFTAHHVA